VLVGFLVYAASSIRLFIPDFSTAMNYYVLAMDAVLYLFTVGTVIVVYRMMHFIGVEKARIWKAFLIAPSFLMFTVYNWDIVAIFFSTLSIYCHLKGDKTKSVLSLGFGIAAKLYPCMLIPVFMLEESNWKGRLKALLAPVAVFVLLNLPFILANFSGWLETWTYHAGWGIEDSWLIFIFNQMDPNAHYFALAVLLYLVYRGVTGTLKKQYKDRPTRSDRTLFSNEHRLALRELRRHTSDGLDASPILCPDTGNIIAGHLCRRNNERAGNRIMVQLSVESRKPSCFHQPCAMVCSRQATNLARLVHQDDLSDTD